MYQSSSGWFSGDLKVLCSAQQKTQTFKLSYELKDLLNSYSYWHWKQLAVRLNSNLKQWSYISGLCEISDVQGHISQDYVR